MSSLKAALAEARINITSYDPTKARPIITTGGNFDFKKLAKTILEKLQERIIKYPEIFKATHDLSLLEELVAKLVEEEDLIPEEEEEESQIEIPDELQNYTLNVNMSARRGEDEFFLTTEDEFMSRTSGRYYINRCNIPPPAAYTMARPVIPDYRPRSGPGVIEELNPQTKEAENIFNSYIPPEWLLWKKENPVEWNKLPESPPSLFLKLVKHLIPLAEERRYFYGWLYNSITTRSYVYLVLCGAPGSGKNRLKLVLRAIHGRENTVDGKKSTLTERFNSQLSKGTLTWFDELKYDSEMENVMKEIQNDYFSIERKGIDATSSSTIYSSLVISNNKPRDNFIAFDARKFAPLVVANKDLRHAMTEKEIDLLTRKVESAKEDFDVKFVAQIVKWIMRVGKKNAANYPNLEYKGPMFWTLAHTSMTRWQKKCISVMTDEKGLIKSSWDENEKAYRWSIIEEKVRKRSGDHASQFPDFSSIKAFFDIFRNSKGELAFETKLVPGDNILGDFYIYKLVKNLKIVTEATVAQQREKERQGNGKKEHYDL